MKWNNLYIIVMTFEDTTILEFNHYQNPGES